MKIFAIYLRINLTKKPKWFDRFREKNDGWFELHITLIQHRYISDNQIERLKLKVESVLKQQKFIEKYNKLVFNKPIFKKNSDGKFIFMWFLEENNELTELQKKLKIALKSYGDYCEKITRKYEANFEPHITIVESIDANQKGKVEKYLSSDSVCEGVITDLTLLIVNDKSREERENPNNFTIFNLQ